VLEFQNILALFIQLTYNFITMGSLDAPELILIIVFPFLMFLIGVYITRWIFKIEAIVEYQKKQYMILRQIANKLGVDEAIIKDIDRPH